MAGRATSPAMQALREADRAEFERQREHQLTLAQEQHRRDVREFMEREGLKTVADCRAYVRKGIARMKHATFGVHTFEEWCRVITQDAIDRMALMDTADDRRVLARMRREGVLDNEGKLVPIELRGALRAAREEEEKRVQEELRARAMGEQ